MSVPLKFREKIEQMMGIGKKICHLLLPLLLVSACDFDRSTSSYVSGNETGIEPGPVAEEVSLGGISGTVPGQSQGSYQPAFSDLSVLFSITDMPIPAGAPTSYQVEVFNGDTLAPGNWLFEVQADPTLGVIIGEETLVFSTPGDYGLTALATNGLQTVSSVASVTVIHGPAASVELSVTPEVVVAGQPVRFEVSVYDEMGNIIENSDAGVVLTVEPSGEQLDEDQWSPVLTEAGAYTVFVSAAEDLSVFEEFTVIWAEPAHLVLELAPHDVLEPGDWLDYVIEVTDAYNNIIQMPRVTVWTVEATTLVDLDKIRFDEEGVYTVYAQVEETDLTAEAGPVLVDEFGPIIEVKVPERGTYVTASPVEVIATVVDTITHVESVNINGIEVVPNEYDEVFASLDLVYGINAIVVEAVDVMGHASTRVLSVLYGESFVESGDFAQDSLVARANEGTLNMLEDLVVAEMDIDAMASSIEGITLASDCITIIPGTIWTDPVEACAYVETDSFYTSGLSADLDPRSSGLVDVDATLYNLEVVVKLHGDLPTLYPYISASSAVLSGSASLWVDGDGEIRVSLSGSSVVLNGFDMGLSGIPDWVNDILTLGDLLTDVVQPMVEDVLADQVEDVLPDVIAEALSELEISTSLEMFSSTLWVVAQPASIEVDEDGISLILESAVYSEEVDETYEGLGALQTENPVPLYGATPEFILSISDDFLNQVFYTLWESGLAGALLGELESLDVSALSLVVPDAEAVAFAVDPLLPPVYSPLFDGTGDGQIQLGDLLLDFVVTESSGESYSAARVAVTAFFNVEITMDSAEAIQISIIGDPVFFFDGLFSVIPELGRDELVALLGAFLPMVLPDFMSSIEAFPLPSFEGMTIDTPSVTIAGPALDYLNIGGDLRVE